VKGGVVYESFFSSHLFLDLMGTKKKKKKRCNSYYDELFYEALILYHIDLLPSKQPVSIILRSPR
jgi:hypothetical protein